MSQRAMDGGETNIQGWMVCLKEPWKDNCSCIIFIPHIHVGKGGETNIQGWMADICSSAIAPALH